MPESPPSTAIPTGNPAGEPGFPGATAQPAAPLRPVPGFGRPAGDNAGATPPGAASRPAPTPHPPAAVDPTLAPPPAPKPPIASGLTLPYAVLRDLAQQMAKRLATVKDLPNRQVLVCEAGDLAGLAAHRRLEADAQRLGTFFSRAQPAGPHASAPGGLESVAIGGAIEVLSQGLNTLDAVIALGPRIRPLLQLFRTERTFRSEEFHFDRLAVLAAMTGPLQPHCAGISALALSAHAGLFPKLDEALRARGQTTRPEGDDRPAQDWDQACDALDQLRAAVAGRMRPDSDPAVAEPGQDHEQSGSIPDAPGETKAVAESLHRGAHLAAALADNAWPLVIEPLSVELIREEERSWRSWFSGETSRHHCRVACAMLLFNPQLNVLCADIFEGGQTRDSTLTAATSVGR